MRIYQPCFTGGKPRGQTPSPLCFGGGLCLCGGLPKAELVLKLCLLIALVEFFNTKQGFFTACETPDKVYVSSRQVTFLLNPCGLQATAQASLLLAFPYTHSRFSFLFPSPHSHHDFTAWDVKLCGRKCELAGPGAATPRQSSHEGLKLVQRCLPAP